MFGLFRKNNEPTPETIKALHKPDVMKQDLKSLEMPNTVFVSDKIEKVNLTFSKVGDVDKLFFEIVRKDESVRLITLRMPEDLFKMPETLVYELFPGAVSNQAEAKVGASIIKRFVLENLPKTQKK